MQEDAGRSGCQQQPDRLQMAVGRGLRDHRLADEAGGQREGRNGQCADGAADRRQRHAVEQPAQFRAFAPPRRGQHGTGRHQQQRLVDDVGEGMGGGAVQRHLGADADAGNHEADLVDDAVGEDAPHVVFQQRIDDAVEHHEQPDPDQDLGAGEAAYQHVHRGLGGEGGEEHRAAPRGFRVGVGQPGRQRRCAGVDQEADQDQPVGDRIGLHAREGGVAGSQQMAGDAGKQDHAAGQVHHGVAQAGGPGGFGIGAPQAPASSRPP